MVLHREETGDHGTFGRLDLGSFRPFTGELPDLGNAPMVSCIPVGTYLCKFTYSPTFKRKLYAVTAVPGRSGIRVHSANYMGNKAKGLHCQLLGCIALGYRRAVVGGQRGIFTSLSAVRDFEMALAGEDFELEIRQ